MHRPRTPHSGPHRARSRRVRARGQAFTELAFIVPLMALLIIGFTDLARAQHARHALAAATHAGLLYAVQDPASAADEGGIRAIILERLDRLQLSGSPDIAVDLSAPSADGFGKQELTVTVSLTVPAVFGLPGLPPTYTLTERGHGRVLDTQSGS